MTHINLSLNGIPGTLWEIRRQEQIHPYLGLRQALLIINSKEKALKEAYLSQKKAALSFKHLKDKVLISKEIELDILLAEIDIAEYDAEMFTQLILDAEAELNAAIQEKERIEKSHPDMVNSDRQELQEKYAAEAFHCKLVRSLVISIYGSYKGISEGASEIIYDSTCLSLLEKEQFDADTFKQLSQLLVTTPSNQPQSSTYIAGAENGVNIN